MNNMVFSEKAAFDVFTDMMAKMMIKHGPKVLQKQREQVLDEMRRWEYRLNRSRVKTVRLLLGYREKYDALRGKHN